MASPKAKSRYDAFVKVGEIALDHAMRPRVAEQALGELRDNTDLADKLIQYYMDSGDISRALASSLPIRCRSFAGSSRYGTPS